jgi:nitrite reductase/ring-hydroxylating ferredoxin subunit
MIVTTGAHQLDADGIALGLIGVLEMLWQGFAFQSEANIDRKAAVERSLNYLRSVFPGHFAASIPQALTAPLTAGANGRLPPRAYADAALLGAEREQLLRTAWQLLGHEAEVRSVGDFLTADLAGERALLVRGERGRLHVLRNSCRRRPHALLAPRRGHLRSAIHCASHSLTYSFDGRLVAGNTPGDLATLEMAREGPLLFVRAAPGGTEPPARAAWEALATLVPRAVTETDVAADWKLVVEQWLENPPSQQSYVAPNTLIDRHAEGAVVLQVTPVAPGKSRIRRFEFAAPAVRGRERARTSWQRRSAAWLRQQIELAESTQAGLAGGGEEVPDTGPVSPALGAFRTSIAALLHALPAAQ